MSVVSLACIKSGGVFLLSMTVKLLLFIFYRESGKKEVIGGTVQCDAGHKRSGVPFIPLRNLIRVISPC